MLNRQVRPACPGADDRPIANRGFPGRSLTGWPRSDPLCGPLSASEGIRVIRQVAEGLRFASASGLIHRRVLRQS